MKNIMKDILYGFLTIIVITIFEFLVTLPYGEPLELSGEEYLSFINQEFLLTSLPAAFTTFIFTWLLRTKTRADAARRGVIWAILLGLSYIFIGIFNNNFGMIFRTAGIYILLVSDLAGPIFYAKVKRLD